MKMTSFHYNELEIALAEAELELVDKKYCDFVATYKDAGHSYTRLIWDILRCIPAATRTYLMDGFYTYLNDVHIETALKSILTKRFNVIKW